MSKSWNDIEQRDSGTLRPHVGNARTHFKKQVRQIADSIERFGFTNPVLVADDGTVIAGHDRVMARSCLAWQRSPLLPCRTCVRLSVGPM